MLPVELRHGAPLDAPEVPWGRTALAWVGITAALATASLVVGLYDRTGGHAVLGLALVTGVVYGFLLRQQAPSVVAATLLFVAEAVAITVLIHLTGGISSELALLYPVVILCASLALPVGAGVTVSVACAAFYVVVVALEAFAVLPYRGGSPYPYQLADDVCRRIGLRVAFFWLFSVGASFCVERLLRYTRDLFHETCPHARLLDKIPVGLLAVGEDLNIRFANRAAAGILDQPAPELVGQKLTGPLAVPSAAEESQDGTALWATTPRRGESVPVLVRTTFCDLPEVVFPDTADAPGGTEDRRAWLVLFFPASGKAPAAIPSVEQEPRLGDSAAGLPDKEGDQESRPRILVVDDESDIRDLLSLLLKNGGYEPVACATTDEAKGRLAVDSFDLVITDLMMGAGPGGMSLLRHVRRHHSMPVVVITAFGTVEFALDAMRAGAFDFIRKPLNMNDLKVTVESALEHQVANSSTVVTARPQLDRHFGCLVGESTPMGHVYRLVTKTARLDIPILVCGETGTGKTLLTEVLHRTSRRGPAVCESVECSRAGTVELGSLLFGRDDEGGGGEGVLAQACGGTVVLENIDYLPRPVQDRLVDYLHKQAGESRGHASHGDEGVRILATTRIELTGEVETGRFSRELYSYLTVITLDLPPLRRRAGDVPLLVHHFLLARGAVEGRDFRITRRALGALRRYSWPGNVAELDKVVARACSRCDEEAVTLDDLPDNIVALAAEPGEQEASGKSSIQGVHARKFLEETRRHLHRHSSRTEDGA